jgi:hypothetical protein
MKKSLRPLLAIAAFALVFSACKKDVAEEENENEVITTVQLIFTPAGGGTSLTYKWEDLDGDGGAAPVIDMVTLAANKTYTAQLLLLDKTKNPVDTTSNEVLEEAIDHRFYFEPSAGSNITVSNLSNDPNGVPVGLTSTWTTDAASAGSMKITLRHYENGGKATTDAVNDAKSSTDAEATFSTRVQ